MASFFRRRRSFIIKIVCAVLVFYILSLFVFATDNKNTLPLVDVANSDRNRNENHPLDNVHNEERHERNIQPHEPLQPQEIHIQQTQHVLNFQREPVRPPLPVPQAGIGGDSAGGNGKVDMKADDPQRPGLQDLQQEEADVAKDPRNVPQVKEMAVDPDAPGKSCGREGGSFE